MAGELAAAVCKVMQSVGHVQKTGRNSHGGYNYASDADLLRAIQPAMADAGLCLVPVKVERTNSERTSKRGNAEDRADVLVTYRLMHSSGEYVDIMAPGTGLDSLDKAPYKAMTGAYKYALRQTFAVPTGDDPERDAPVLKNRQAGKAPEWRALQAAIGAAGLKYDDYRDWCEWMGWGRVDSWSVADWSKAAGDVEKQAGDVKTFLRDVKGAE